MIRQLIRTTAAAALVAISAAAADAQTFSFVTSVGTQPPTVGTITLTQAGASVNVLVDLLPGYGFLNTGGQHTPFAFNLAGTSTNLAATFSQPSGGVYSSGAFTLNPAGGANTPYGTYGIAIDSDAGNGSSQAYFGDLAFSLTRDGGLLTTDFVANAAGYYFSADLTNGQNTGAQAWASRTGGSGTGSVVPEPSTYLLMGSGLLGLAGIARRRRNNV